MKKFRILLLTSSTCCLMLSGIIFFSCTEHQEVITDSTKLIEPRTIDGVWPDSVFELHNEYILWVFDNYMDSAMYYANDQVDFMEFAARMSMEFNRENFDCSELLINDTLIMPSPYYIKNQGFTYLPIYTNWSYTERNSLHSALDSIETAIESSEPEYILQGLIDNATIRASNLNTTYEDAIINCLTQASYSIALAYQLEDLYGGIGSPTNPANGLSIFCLIKGIKADVCTIALMNSAIIGLAFSDYTPTERYNFVREISMYALSQCVVECG